MGDDLIVCFRVVAAAAVLLCFLMGSVGAQSSTTPRKRDCEFPQFVEIHDGNLFLICTKSDTISFFEGTVEVDYRDGEFIIEGVGTMPRTPIQHADETLIRLYGDVPFVALWAQRSTWNEAVATYFDSTAFLISSLRQRYAAEVVEGTGRMKAARTAAAWLRPHPFVDPDSVIVLDPRDSRYEHPRVLIKWKGRAPEDYLLWLEPSAIQPNYLDRSTACGLVTMLRRSMTSDRPSAVLFRNGTFHDESGAEAVVLIEKWRNR